MATELAQYEGRVVRVSARNAGGLQLDGYDGWFNVSQYANPKPELPAVGDFIAAFCNAKGFVESIDIIEAGPNQSPRPQSAPRPQNAGQQPRQNAPSNAPRAPQTNQPAQSGQRPANASPTPPAAASEAVLPAPVRIRLEAARLAIELFGMREGGEHKTAHVIASARMFDHYLRTGDFPPAALGVLPTNANANQRQNGTAPKASGPATGPEAPLDMPEEEPEEVPAE